MSGYMSNVYAADWKITPSIQVTETYTDNVDLDSSISQSDFVTQVSPGLLITGNGPRLSAVINYAPNYFFYPGDANDKHDLRQSLRANLTGEFVRDTFFIDASANIAQRFLDRRQAITSTQVGRTDNRRTVQAYQVSPYLVHAFGTWASAELRYTLSEVRQSADPSQTTPDTFFGNSLTNKGSFRLTSGRRFNKFGWTLSATHRNEEREATSSYKETIARADFSYQLTRIFALLGSAGYQKRDTANGSFVNFDGFIWDAGFRLAPGPRTSISFRYGNQFIGKSFSLNAQYKITAKDSINLSFQDTIQTFQSFAFENNGAVNVDPLLNSGFISGDLTRRKQWSLSLAGVRGRTTYSASGLYSKYTSDNTALDDERYGAAFSTGRNLSRRLNISAGFNFNISKFASDGIKDKFWSASANANYQLSKSLLATLGYVHTNRDQARFNTLNGGSNYISLSIRAAI
ncbi:MAG: TIGR03016 family PEP-CTERM system-associated outer membrane protein [Alphaproteobacteria bacterium]|nr:TIGR03016 family PEP-CTERM system-associated outer membrane protein [Alphaproteobacteria bacterium]